MAWPAKLRPWEPRGQRAPRIETALSSHLGARDGEVHMLICAPSYENCPEFESKLAASARMNRKNMISLAQQSGVKDVEVLAATVPEPEDRFGLEWARCTKYNVIRKIGEIGRRVRSNDYFIFYYCGHGTQLPDEVLGDEFDGKDEAMVFLDYEGTIADASKSIMDDDEFSKLVSSRMPDGARVILIIEACHSATMGDLDRPCWKGKDVISIASCPDAETSKAFRLTSCMMLAVEKISTAKLESKQAGDESVGLVFNAMLHEQNEVLKTICGDDGSDFQVRCVPWLSTGGMAWPLFPAPPEKFENPDLFWVGLTAEAGRLEEEQVGALKKYFSEVPDAEYLKVIRSHGSQGLLSCLGQGYAPNVSAPTAPSSCE
eukprot:TRINITY_DN71415_c0_g1_i1.p1 TRINITY_DN71415_c0_g1~~TRINITY_DN71415_c0_g1_i1.p1  ORF type:complete len:374 (+),score=70.75 TRINITY_DN71415_c0_g1_i1:66-1187(+)